MATETSVAADPSVIPVATETTVNPAVLERSMELLESKLPPEQAEQVRANRKAKKATPAKEAPAAEPAKAEPEAKPTPEAKAEVETIDFNEPDKAPPETPAEEVTPEALTDDEVSKLSDKARKQYLEAHKEAAKIRKRAQDAEAKLAEKDTLLTEQSTKLTAAEQRLQEILTRGPALVGNEFGSFTDGKAVAAYGTNAREAVALLAAHERAVKAGRADADDTVIHSLPDGSEIEIKLEAKQAFEQRVKDAAAWFEADHKVGLNRETAKAVSERHANTTGYTAAHQSYLTDATMSTRIPEMAAKAAFYDMLMSRKAHIQFPDTAVAATKATSPAVSQGQAATKKPATPSETSASTPRMAASMDGADNASRKSHLMEMARTAPDYETQQKYLKQASMIPSTSRTFAKNGSRSSAA